MVLFDRHLARTDIPHIRFHDLRHTHASLLVAAGTPIKAVSERLGHAHPGFTMATYQNLVPGTSATAAFDFANHQPEPADGSASDSLMAAGRGLPDRRREPAGHSVAAAYACRQTR